MIGGPRLISRSSARESVLRSTSEVLGQVRDELREEFKLVLEEKERAFNAKLAALVERLKSSPGKLPVVKSSWQPESVTYQAEMVCHNGTRYQARKDTVQPPGGSDWVCVARHGRDAVTPNVRGNYDVHECVTPSWTSFHLMAMRTSPGATIRASSPVMVGN